MTTRILLTALRPHPLPLSIGLGISSIFAAQSFLSTQQPSRYLLRCDAAPTASTLGGGYTRYEQEAKVPLTKSGRLNPGAVRQMSLGSITGLLCGLGVSVFSKPLALLIGLLILGVQGLESRGIHLIPYNRLQGYFTNTDVRTALQDNVALKVSFGLAFGLAGFMSF